ncbi:hypothetical protein S1OALGB6SA_504 [Olavius algarvensis spirochete endosymbiont]|uniref:hypothetical protein n=1 Tax=Olavius algarvensis spirochete endosymbiont TaxID=260710 RepID=UPI000F296D2A|nr:hypothetical protein [Olavius algarvensis spirochete endosymbiont]VDA99436.1 hypothetical protein S1OALGB6SA_504 [Olavius algarvensis spirochete endosymbiont]
MNTRLYAIKSIILVRQIGGFFKFSTAIILFSVLIMPGCAPDSNSRKSPFSVDLLPPVLQSAEIVDERHLRFIFDEPLAANEINPVVNPPMIVNTFDIEDEQLTIGFETDQEIGREYTIRMSVTDESGNSLSFLYGFSGWNPRIPGILINEINPRGSGNTPDCIELFVTKAGNLGGLILLIGTKNKYKESFIFPAVEVPEGEYILVHTKAEGIPEEIDEISTLNLSGGKLASETARDFWMRGAPGLPGNNGAVTLYARKNGTMLDAILWSDREDDREDERLGWTKDGFIFASDLAEAKAWNSVSGGVPAPSDAADANFSTSTRSICRSSVPNDTDSARDWHIVPTRGQTFGAINTDRVYEP